MHSVKGGEETIDKVKTRASCSRSMMVVVVMMEHAGEKAERDSFPCYCRHEEMVGLPLVSLARLVSLSLHRRLPMRVQRVGVHEKRERVARADWATDPWSEAHGLPCHGRSWYGLSPSSISSSITVISINPTRR